MKRRWTTLKAALALGLITVVFLAPGALPTPSCVQLRGIVEAQSCPLCSDMCFITADPCMYPSGCPPGEIMDEHNCCQPDPNGHCPVVLDIRGDGFDLTDPAGGVFFPTGPTDIAYQAAWTAPGSDDAWLVLDRNGNGRIDDGTELFGNHTPQPDPPPGELRHGYLALAEYDKRANGGNEDGIIDRRDAVFARLRLWQDVSHDGESQGSELHRLPALGVAGLRLDYKTSRRTDEFGNSFRYRARVIPTRQGDVARWSFDVFLVVQRAR